MTLISTDMACTINADFVSPPKEYVWFMASLHESRERLSTVKYLDSHVKAELFAVLDKEEKRLREFYKNNA